MPEFEGKVNCIYIDPPYNTGNESWVYNDNVNDPKIRKWLGQVVGKEGEDLSRHDKWLCMMYPRLKLLHRLLADNGVIFISIDDIEACYLKLLLDEVFGMYSFIGHFVWKSRQNKDNRTKNGASIDHEYVFAYGKMLRGLERNHEQFKNPDYDPRGVWVSGNMVGLADEKARPNLHYELINPETKINYGKPKQGWRFDKNRMASLIAEKRILWPEKDTGRPRLKVFLQEMQSEFTGFSSLIGEQFFTYHGTRELGDIFDARVFDFPKPSDFVLELIQQGTLNKNDIVLDSFAGSGTTAHAVLKLNAQDGGNRRFILIETMEYAETITAERVRRAMDGYSPKGEGGKPVAGLGGSFDFYTIGEPIFLPDTPTGTSDNLNEAVGLAAIRHYVAYAEGIPAADQTPPDNPYSPHLLGLNTDMAWLFNYAPVKVTVLDLSYLSGLKFGDAKPARAIIYADRCLLESAFMAQHGITFKKIPRDISRF